MVVAMHPHPSFTLARQSSDTSRRRQLNLINNEDDDATDIKPEAAAAVMTSTTTRPSMKRPRHRRVTFDVETTVMEIPNREDLTNEEKNETYFSGQELLSIRLELRALVIQWQNECNAATTSSITKSNFLNEQTPTSEDEKIRGLEIYVQPWKDGVATRRDKAYGAVVSKFQSRTVPYEGCVDTDETVATLYAEITAYASERAHKLGLIDQDRAWTSDELDRSVHAPLYQTMDR